MYADFLLSAESAFMGPNNPWIQRDEYKGLEHLRDGGYVLQGIPQEYQGKQLKI